MEGLLMQSAQQLAIMKEIGECWKGIKKKKRDTDERAREKKMGWVDEIPLERTVSYQEKPHRHALNLDLAVHGPRRAHPFSAAPLISGGCTIPPILIVFLERWSREAHLRERRRRSSETGRRDKSPAWVLQAFGVSCGRGPGLSAQPGSLTKATSGLQPRLGERLRCH